MYLRRNSQNFAATPSCQQGSMLVIALFVIIVLALLGLTMTRLLSSTSETIIHEVLGQRAINAAKSGIECAVASKFGAGCSNPVYKELSGVAGLESCNYRVAETLPKTITDGGRTFTYLTFTGTGQCTAGKINVTRFVYVDAMLEVE
jgi:MSHA biogenesis protein MshP